MERIEDVVELKVCVCGVCVCVCGDKASALSSRSWWPGDKASALKTADLGGLVIIIRQLP